MEQKYFTNPYEDYRGENVEIDETKVKQLIQSYVDQILVNSESEGGDSRGDLYVGDSGEPNGTGKKHVIFNFQHF